MNQLIKEFNFIGNEVRVSVRDGETWFVLADIAKILDHSNPSRMADGLRDNQKANQKLGFGSDAIIINQSGLYRILLRSNKPEAERFQIWVEDEVLPSIRKHGVYAMPATIESMIADPDFAISLLQKLKDETELKQATQRELQIVTYEKNRLLHSGRTYTATEIAKECGMRSALVLNRLLEEKGFQYLNHGTWVTHAKYSEMGLISLKQVELTNGRIEFYRHFTDKGRDFILGLVDSGLDK